MYPRKTTIITVATVTMAAYGDVLRLAYTDQHTYVSIHVSLRRLPIG
ncbi:hypothetical protein ACO0K2_15615 [Undibacterium sp. MH2W]